MAVGKGTHREADSSSGIAVGPDFQRFRKLTLLRDPQSTASVFQTLLQRSARIQTLSEDARKLKPGQCCLHDVHAAAASPPCSSCKCPFLTGLCCRKQSRQQFTEATAAGKGWWVIFSTQHCSETQCSCCLRASECVSRLMLCRWEIMNPTNMHVVASAEEFRERVRLAKGENTLVVVDYFAPWCHACKSLHPKLQKLALENRHVTFLSVSLLRCMLL